MNRWLKMLGCVCVWLLSGGVQAAYVPSHTVLLDHQVFVIHADATFTHDIASTVRVDTEQGVKDYGEASVSHNADMETLEVLEAWVKQPDGALIHVPPENIKLRDAYVDEDAPIFSNEKKTFIVFPQVRVGSELHYRVRSVQREALFPGHFSWYDYQLPYFPVDRAQVDVYYATGINLQFKTRAGYVERTLKPATVRDQRRALSVPEKYLNKSFIYSETKVRSYEENAVSPLDYAPAVMFSNFAGPADLAKAYERRARPRSQPDDAIRALAQRLTEGAVDERERVQRLHAWVAQNIRYVGTYIGAGGFVPNPASQVLARHYGDCKDHAALLQALLAAVGIESSPALINSGRAYELMPITLTAPFNHVINYIPSLDLFVDSTARYARTGTLPFGDMDKPTLITQTGEVKYTPKPSPETDAEIVETHWELKPNGDMVGRTRFTKTGWLEVASRAYHADNQNTDQGNDSRWYLRNQLEVGTGETHAPDADDWSKPWVVETTTELKGYVNLPEPSAFTIPIGMAPGTLADLASQMPPAERESPWICTSRRVEEHTWIRLPDGVEVTHMPRARRLQGQDVGFDSKIRVEGEVVEVARTLKASFSDAACAATLSGELGDFLRALQRDIKGQIFISNARHSLVDDKSRTCGGSERSSSCNSPG